MTPLAGRFIVRAGFRRSLLCALAVSAAGLLMTLAPSLALIVCGLAICSSGVFTCQGATISFIADSVSEGRSLATGLYNLAYYAGGAAGAGIAGFAFETHGWQGSVATIILVQCLAAIIAWFGWRR